MIVQPHPSLEDPRQQALIQAIQGGLPLVARPYAEIGRQIGLEEDEVMARLRGLLEQGVISRLGVVVRHRELGYSANAMVVWDVPDTQVAEVGRRLGGFPCVTLSYRRPRRLPDWPYNLFTMIHGRDQEQVLAHLEQLVQRCGLEEIPHLPLFSTRCFKQRGARYDLGATR